MFNLRKIYFRQEFVRSEIDCFRYLKAIRELQSRNVSIVVTKNKSTFIIVSFDIYIY